MKNKLIFLVFFVFIIFLPHTFADSTPDWIKNTAGWWAEDQISETEFVNAIEFLVNSGIIQVEDTCIYKINIIFKNNDQKKLEQLCSNYYDLDYTKEISVKKTLEIKLNEQGFRGEIITLEKPSNTYRVFLIGGSTVLGGDNAEDELISYHLQKKFDEQDLGVKVEIFNGGLSGQWSQSETSLIKNNLVNFSPDLFLVLDGWNDHSRKIADESKANENIWKENWIDLCKFGKENKFDTIVALEPLVGTGKKLLTDQEYQIYVNRGSSYLASYPLYANQLGEIGKYCTNTVDLRNIFDYSPYPIFFDEGHKNSKGNEIIAEEFYKMVLPLILEEYEISPDLIQIISEKSSSRIQPNTSSDDLNYSWQVISNKDLTKIDLKNANFEGAVIKNTDFSGANLEGANFRFSDIDKTNFENTNMKNIDLSRSVVTNSNLKDADMKGGNAFGSILINVGLENTIMTNMDLKVAKILGSFFEKTDLTNSDLSLAKLESCNLKNSHLHNLIIHHTYFLGCDFTDVDMSVMNFQSGNKLAGSIFKNTTFPKELHDVDFTAKFSSNERAPGAKLNDVDFHKTNIKDVIFSDHLIVNLKEMELQDFRKNYGVDATNANFSSLNLSDKNLSLITFISVNFSSSNLSNTDLRYSDLTNANLEGANLEGANLEGANLNCLNHIICN